MTLVEFEGIREALCWISDTWAELWEMLYLTHEKPNRLLRVKYEDINESRIILSPTARFPGASICLTPRIETIVYSRRKRYPNDLYLFQSHSNRKKSVASPVTLVAFNAALKVAASKVTDKIVSSKSAYIG